MFLASFFHARGEKRCEIATWALCSPFFSESALKVPRGCLIQDRICREIMTLDRLAYSTVWRKAYVVLIDGLGDL